MRSTAARAGLQGRGGDASSTPRILAIDAGKTACRASLFVDGRRGPVQTGPGFENVAAPRGLAQIRAALSRTITAVDVSDVEAVCIGLTGLLPPSAHGAAVVTVVTELLPRARPVVTSDVVTSYAGALGLRSGVVVAAGTGAITLAVAEDGRAARVDGWGYLLDDAGSAFTIGRAGLRAALRATDGRGGSPALHAAAMAAFGDTAGITEAVYSSDNPARTIAQFARAVTTAGLEGDTEANAILAEAGTDLATAAASAARAVLDVEEPVAVSWQGGVLRGSRPVREAFLAALADALPAARPQPPHGDALDGAAALAGVTGWSVLDTQLETTAEARR